MLPRFAPIIFGNTSRDAFNTPSRLTPIHGVHCSGACSQNSPRPTCAGIRAGVARVVHEQLHVERFECGLHRAEVGHIARDARGAASGRLDLFDDAVRAFGRKVVDVDGARVVRGEMQRDLAADALARAGDQRVFALQVQYVHPSSPYAARGIV